MPPGLAWEVILQQAASPVLVLDLQGRFIFVNPAACDFIGCSAEELLGRQGHDFKHPEEPDYVRDLIANDLDQCSVEKRVVRADGEVVWVLISYALIRDSDGEPRCVLAQHQDITARRAAEQRWRQTFADAPIGMARLDLTGRWLEVNDKLCDIVGYTHDELQGMRFMDLTYPADDSGVALLADLVAGRLKTGSLEKRYRHKDGHPIWILLRVSAVAGADDQPAYLVAQYESIGDRETRDSHMAHLALHDPLTGLANRALLMDRLDQELASLSRRDGVLTVLLADLDGLKRINDSYGHAAGDQLLTIAADELLKAVRPGDTVARLGGDEFVILAWTPDARAAMTFRDDVAQRMNADIVVAGHETRLSASVGIATTQTATTMGCDLLHSADLDMYARKLTSR